MMTSFANAMYDSHYDSGTFKVTDIFSVIHSITSVYLWSVHGCVRDLMHQFAIGVVETPAQ